MSTLLLISDNEVLNSLYAVNLKIYTDSELVCFDNIDQSIDHINDPENEINAVICVDRMGREDTALIAYNSLLESGLFDIPFYVVGNKGELTEDMDILEDPFDIKNVIGTLAKRLGITAKDMVRKKVPDYYPMPIRMFFSLQHMPCDVYILKDDHFNQIYEDQDPVFPKIKSYLDQKVTTLYVHSSMRFKFVTEVTTALKRSVEKLTKKSPREEKLEVVQQGIETVAERLFQDTEVTQEVLDLSSKCMKVMMNVIETVPSLKELIKDLTSNKAGFLYSHSIIAGYVANHILDNIEWGGESHKEKLKFVLFFHDMHLTTVYKNHSDLEYEESLVFDERLSEEEKEVVISHAAQAAESIKNYPQLPLGVDSIIRQHHGTSNGMGFATTYKDDISPLAKVLIVAEAFTEKMLEALYSGEQIDVAQTCSDLKTKFPKHTYVKITKTLLNIKL